MYGFRSSGLCWHQLFVDVLRLMGFNPSKADADIWMRESNGLYQYIALYVDDLLIAARYPNEIIIALSEKHEFKLKGFGPLLHTIWVAINFGIKTERYAVDQRNTLPS
jgi:Reverse transcriptase (RNA-dependent DNA polymerase)